MKDVPGSEFGVQSFGVRAVQGVAVLLLLFSVSVAPARTITLTDRDVDRLASINEQHPRASWAGMEYAPGTFSDGNLGISPTQGVLLRYPIDQIPANQRIINAELAVPTYSGTDWYRMFAWRLVADWGPGVCHLYRRTRPDKVAWAQPGARGPGVDRATEPTRIVRPKVGGWVETTMDVTRDIQLWYTGAAQNYGWLLTAEDEGHGMFLYSIDGGYGSVWRLRITYEPL